MPLDQDNRLPHRLFWSGLLAVMIVPVLIAAASPYLASRSVVYVIGGFSGILGLSLFVVQPLLAAGRVPGAHPGRVRKAHRMVGAVIVALVALHLGGLYLTSPQDVIDALLLRAPTLFSFFGVMALWGVVFIAIMALTRPQWSRHRMKWAILHRFLGVFVVLATAIHAVQITGAMGGVSKWLVCIAACATALTAIKGVRKRPRGE